MRSVARSNYFNCYLITEKIQLRKNCNKHYWNNRFYHQKPIFLLIFVRLLCFSSFRSAMKWKRWARRARILISWTDPELYVMNTPEIGQAYPMRSSGEPLKGAPCGDVYTKTTCRNLPGAVMGWCRNKTVIYCARVLRVWRNSPSYRNYLFDLQYLPLVSQHPAEGVLVP